MFRFYNQEKIILLIICDIASSSAAGCIIIKCNNTCVCSYKVVYMDMYAYRPSLYVHLYMCAWVSVSVRGSAYVAYIWIYIYV